MARPDWAVITSSDIDVYWECNGELTEAIQDVVDGVLARMPTEKDDELTDAELRDIASRIRAIPDFSHEDDGPCSVGGLAVDLGFYQENKKIRASDVVFSDGTSLEDFCSSLNGLRNPPKEDKAEEKSDFDNLIVSDYIQNNSGKIYQICDYNCDLSGIEYFYAELIGEPEDEMIFLNRMEYISQGFKILTDFGV